MRLLSRQDFTLEATNVRRWEAAGSVSGQGAIEKRYAAEFASGLSNHVSKLVQIYPIGSDICAITEWSVGPWKSLAHFVGLFKSVDV